MIASLRSVEQQEIGLHKSSGDITGKNCAFVFYFILIYLRDLCAV
jgi:hypothetical protein